MEGSDEGTEKSVTILAKPALRPSKRDASRNNVNDDSEGDPGKMVSEERDSSNKKREDIP